MKLQTILLALLVFTAFFLRIYKIDQVPASLYYDEVDYGYQARSLIETGKDYRGSLSPFYVHSFNDIRAPIPAYFTALTTLLFSKPELQVRMPFVISGTLVVALVFFLMQFWSKKTFLPFLTALVFAINPWQIQFSRFSHEAMVMELFYLSGLLFFFISLKFKNYFQLLASIILFSLCLYTYRTMSFFIPITFLVLFILYNKHFLCFGVKKFSLLLLSAAFIMIPFLIFTTIKAPDIPRINQLAITSDPTIPIWIQRNREIDSGDLEDATLGKKAVFSSYIFHNKPLSWAYSFSSNHLQTFSVEFLFLKGDPNLRHSIGGIGEIFFIEALALISGLFYIVRNIKTREYKFLLIWFLAAPIPAALTVDGARHGARLFIFSAPLLIIIGIGWWYLFKNIQKINYHKRIIFLILVIWVFQFVVYYHRYLKHYPIESARYFGYGFKQAMSKISLEEDKYKKIAMVGTNDPPMIYYLFWSKTPPEYLQDYGSNFSDGRILQKKLDKYKVIDWPDIRTKEEMVKYLNMDTLYLLTQNELPKQVRDNIAQIKEIKLIDEIKYPDQQIAFYLLTKN
ncbi:glycosyltransferase family 39 protein [Candidatus Daviesbacteria bacterium]|nr:glycosyltransferase family 39 protein [Candidatus Daviesbacteria bacterium]